MKATIAILHGFAEGPVTSTKFEEMCRRAGYRVTYDLNDADIIFAHSGGCYLIPPQNRARLVVMVGLPYWPGRPLPISLIIKVWREFRQARSGQQFAQRLRKLWYQTRYAGAFRTIRQMAQNQRLSSPWNSRQPQIIVRNRYDAYCTPNVAAAPFKGARTFISLPGEHDDCWDNPERYLDLIQSVL